jgi:hypothetical protein
MKKLSLLVSAITAGIFTTAQADISVSGSSVIAYQSADSNNNSAHGGAVSFALSTTTDAGMTVSSGAGITLSASGTTASIARAVSGFQNITFATGGTTVVLGNDVGVPDGVGDVGGVVGDIAALNNNGMKTTVGITDDEGTGMSLTTTFGSATVGLYYIADNDPTNKALGDIDGATKTGTGAKFTTTVGDVGVTLGYATYEDSSADDEETGIALTYAAMGGTLSVGYENSTGTNDGNQAGVSYAMTLDSATVSIGFSSADMTASSSTQTDVAVSYPLGGGVSVFAEMRSVSGDTGTDTTSTANSTMAIGSSITF